MIHQDIDFQADEFGREIGDPGRAHRSISVLDDDALPLRVTKLTQSVPERGKEGTVGENSPITPTPGTSLASLLRPGRERRKNEADSENDEPDQPHAHLG